MGMYTELVLKAEVKEGIPQNVKSVLQFLFNDADMPDDIPEHEFFACDRWRNIGNSSSYYHVPFALSRYEGNYIFSRSDLKNYADEIDKFVNWLTPYLNEPEGKCIGWSWYEEMDVPTLLIMHNVEFSGGAPLSGAASAGTKG